MIMNFPYFARLWFAETAFTRVYLRVSSPETAICGVFGIFIFSYAKLTSAAVIFFTGNKQIFRIMNLSIFVKKIHDNLKLDLYDKKNLQIN